MTAGIHNVGKPRKGVAVQYVIFGLVTGSILAMAT
ncbi:branched-chain amino acid ABC transporter permease, partial [Mycobacterium tuberculosis]